MKSAIAITIGILLGVLSSAGWAGGEPARGKEKSAVCAGCHGPDGNSTIAANPVLAGQHESYLLRAMQAYKSGARQNPIMAAFANSLSDQDMADLAAYFASQTGLRTPPTD